MRNFVTDPIDDRDSPLGILNRKCKAVDSREDLIEFIKALSEDFIQNKNDWENVTLDQYFESVSAWAENSVSARGDEFVPEQPTWGAVALIFYSGRFYE